MDFNKIVEFYERVASTRKRLKIIDIITEMFDLCIKEGKMDEIKKIIYLTQGKLVPDYREFPKFGLAEKMIIEALVKFTGNNGGKIKDLVNQEGDVGMAAEILLKKRSQGKVSYSLDAFTSSKKKSKDKDLDVNHLYNQLKKISKAQGEGSQDKKINLIMGILRKSKPTTAKYIINIILSTLRIGLADKTIMDGLTKAVTGSKEKRGLVEEAYMIYPDLGEIAVILIQEGLKGIKKVEISVGRPIQMMLASRVRYTEIQKKLGGESMAVEYKYDGERVQVHKKGEKVLLFSRQLKNITDQYPDVVKAVNKYVNAENAVFEGEAVAMDTFYEKMRPFQVLSTRRRKYDIEEKIEEVPVCLFCFDILFINGENVMNVPLIRRREILTKMIPTKDPIRPSIYKMVHNTQEMVEFFEKARSEGAEGIMCKSVTEESIYQAGNRGFLWIKLKALEGGKLLDSIDAVIVGASWGKGRNKGYLSTLYCAIYNQEDQVFEFLTRVGSGLTENDLEYFTQELMKIKINKKPSDLKCRDNPDVWVQPKIVIEIIGDELTVSNKADAGATLLNQDGYGLRFPVFQRIRDDKQITQITTTEEIIQLYENQ